jgi:GDP-L-fucose synthase
MVGSAIWRELERHGFNRLIGRAHAELDLLDGPAMREFYDDLQNSHVLPALIRKFHEAKVAKAPTVTCWGTGSPLREFVYADDIARACVFLMENYSEEQFINVGSASEVTIRGLTETVKRIVGFEGDIVWDTSKPDGTPRKLMDNSRLFALGWRPQVDLETGIRSAYEDFVRRFG